MKNFTKESHYIEGLCILMMVLSVALLPRLDSQILLGAFIHCFSYIYKDLCSSAEVMTLNLTNNKCPTVFL